MIEFMVIAAPRSGTTWAANWLTTDTTLCLHDPLFQHHYSELDAIPSKKMVGVSCTGLYNFPEWVNAHPARKIILHRDLKEINQSLAAIGLPELASISGLDAIEGYHCDWMDIFERPAGLYEHLLGKEFDAERHKYLAEIEMQPKFSKLPVNHALTHRLIHELQQSGKL